MTVRELLNELNGVDKNLPIRFDFCNLQPHSIMSHRGIYKHPSIVPDSDRGRGATVGKFFDQLKHVIDGGIFASWKNDDVILNPDAIVRVDYPGQSTQTVVSGLEIKPDKVTILTKRQVLF